MGDTVAISSSFIMKLLQKYEANRRWYCNIMSYVTNTFIGTKIMSLQNVACTDNRFIFNSKFDHVNSFLLSRNITYFVTCDVLQNQRRNSVVKKYFQINLLINHRPCFRQDFLGQVHFFSKSDAFDFVWTRPFPSNNTLLFLKKVYKR